VLYHFSVPHNYTIFILIPRSQKYSSFKNSVKLKFVIAKRVHSVHEAIQLNCGVKGAAQWTGKWISVLLHIQQKFASNISLVTCCLDQSFL